MEIFECAGCGAPLTTAVTRVRLPGYARTRFWHDLLPPLMEPGTYAIDPRPYGPPWRELTEEEQKIPSNTGLHAVSEGPPGTVVLAPGDVRGTTWIPERWDGYCLGLDGRLGPNLACGGCGLAVATRIDDCSLWQEVRLDPRTTRTARSPSRDVPVEDPFPWETLETERLGTPPVVPAGHWDDRWIAELSISLAGVVVASAGLPLLVPDDLDPAVVELLALILAFGGGSCGVARRRPSNGGFRLLALVGPDRPAPTPPPESELIGLVPRLAGTSALRPFPNGKAVPLDSGVWTRLARGRTPTGHSLRAVRWGARNLEHDFLRDDPLPLIPNLPLSIKQDLFLDVLRQAPGLREPWLRRILDGVRASPLRRFH